MKESSTRLQQHSAYVYAIIVGDICRYIGKGRGRRAPSHFVNAKRLIRRRQEGQKVKTSLFYNRLASAIKKGVVVSWVLIAEGLTDEEAFALEETHIAACSTLWNVLPGGKGGDRQFFSSFWADPKNRKHQSDQQKRVWADPAYRAHQEAVMKVSCRTPEFKARRSKNMIERFASDEYWHRHSESQKERWRNDRVTILADLQRGKEKAREKFSAATKKKWADPEWRAKLCLAQKARWTPEARAARSALMKAKYAARKHT